MGGIELVAIALSESPTIEEFGRAVGMTENEIENLKVILVREGFEIEIECMILKLTKRNFCALSP